MPTDQQLAPARLQEIKFVKDSPPEAVGDAIDVQFNPQSLRVTYSNTVENGEAPGTAGMQFVAKTSTKLDADLWFDASVKRDVDDVRRLTDPVKRFISPAANPVDGKSHYQVPAVRFHWGTFVFDGVMTSLTETIDMFSADGHPLRAKLTTSFANQDLEQRREAVDKARGGGPGTTPRPSTGAGEPLQSVAGRLGDPSGWPALAAASGIENPRRVAPGTLLNLSGGLR